MGKPRKKTRSQPSDSSATADNSATGLPVGDDTGTGLTSAIPSDFDATDLNPQTCCSNCQTVFEVSLELLSSTDTRVRCGECLSIFDALANLRDLDDVDEDLLVDADGNVIEPGESPRSSRHNNAADEPDYHGTSRLPDASAAALAGLSNDTSSLDVTYSDFDLFSADAGLPEVTYFDQTRDSPRFDFDEVVDDDDETFSDTLFARDVTVDARSTVGGPKAKETVPGIALESDVDYVTDDIPREPLIFNYRERETLTPGSAAAAASPYDPPPDPNVYGGVERNLSVPADSSTPWFVRSVLFFIVLAIAGGLYGYRERDTLPNSPVVRPVMEAACKMLSCELPAQVDLGSLKAVNRTVVSHPTLANALIIKFGIVNDAEFSQPYPVLEIRLTDRAGRLVVTNSFSPSDYTEGWQAGDVLDIGKRLDISLTVEDPGNTAMSFELDFLQSRQ